MLLVVAVRNVLSSDGRIETRRLVMGTRGIRVSGGEHEMIGSTPESGRHGETGELVTSGGHDGGFGLSDKGSVLEVHALETMSQCRHVGSRLASLRTVSSMVVVACHGLVVCRAALAYGLVVSVVEVVATLTLTIGNGRHLLWYGSGSLLYT